MAVAAAWVTMLNRPQHRQEPLEVGMNGSVCLVLHLLLGVQVQVQGQEQEQPGDGEEPSSTRAFPKPSESGLGRDGTGGLGSRTTRNGTGIGGC